MELAILGISSRSSSLEIREKATRALEVKTTSFFSVDHVFLSTCHRVEIYFSAESIEKVVGELFLFLEEKLNISMDDLIYIYQGEEVFLHLARVTCGLDSDIVGESEIQSQVKKSYEKARGQRKLSSQLHFLFQKTLKLAKDIRSTYGDWKKQFCLEDALWVYLQEEFSQLSDQKMLFIGNSEINRRLMAFLRLKGLFSMTLCTASPNSYESLKKGIDLRVVSREHLEKWIEYDVIFAATRSSDYLLQPPCSKNIGNKVIFDLSLPRSVHPGVGYHPEIRLINLEDLYLLFEEKKKGYQTELVCCEKETYAKAQRTFFYFQQKHLQKQMPLLSLN